MKEVPNKYLVLMDEVKAMADKTSHWSRENKKKSFNIYIAIATSSAFITFFIAIQNDVPERWHFCIKVTTLLLGGLSTVLAAWDGFYNHKELWINYGETRNQLRALQLRLKLMGEEDGFDEEKFGEIYDEYQEILRRGNKKWQEMRANDKD